ncbi:hypothetical protein B4135_4103 [Caldibacillus debilis]|uniref:Uncharacterized protein n=1 Tax=Caldibacillus debilis TaxID=301148 RepID=A0A150L8S2_9BACI|nr:hypothetical protein B4135_4103 [Caldibacillus debilis]
MPFSGRRQGIRGCLHFNKPEGRTEEFSEAKAFRRRRKGTEGKAGRGEWGGDGTAESGDPEGKKNFRKILNADFKRTGRTGRGGRNGPKRQKKSPFRKEKPMFFQ